MVSVEDIETEEQIQELVKTLREIIKFNGGKKIRVVMGSPEFTDNRWHNLDISESDMKLMEEALHCVIHTLNWLGGSDSKASRIRSILITLDERKKYGHDPSKRPSTTDPPKKEKENST